MWGQKLYSFNQVDSHGDRSGAFDSRHANLAIPLGRMHIPDRKQTAIHLYREQQPTACSQVAYVHIATVKSRRHDLSRHIVDRRDSHNTAERPVSYPKAVLEIHPAPL